MAMPCSATPPNLFDGSAFSTADSLNYMFMTSYGSAFMPMVQAEMFAVSGAAFAGGAALGYTSPLAGAMNGAFSLGSGGTGIGAALGGSAGGGLGASAGSAFDAGMGVGGLTAGVLGGASAISSMINAGLARMQAAESTATAVAGGALAVDDIASTGICFVAGTLVATPNGPQPIESLRVGDRVRTYGGDESGATAVDARTWREVRLRMPNPDGSNDVIEVEILRPQGWLEDVGAVEGAWIAFGLPEMELFGPARVESVSAVPRIQGGPGRVVRATVTHLNSVVHELRFDETDETLRPTATHRLYSVSRGAWVPASELQIGDRVASANAALTVASNARKPHTYRVFNIEVETDHSYLVGGAEILSHNVNPCAAAANVQTSILPEATFIGQESGPSIVVPRGATGPLPTQNGLGVQYTGGAGGPGVSPKVSSVRIMEPTAPAGPSPGYPSGYASYSNASGQVINPMSGQTVPKSSPWWHIPL